MTWWQVQIISQGKPAGRKNLNRPLEYGRILQTPTIAAFYKSQL